MDMGLDHAVDIHMFEHLSFATEAMFMCIAFKPRILLLVPFLSLTLLLLHHHERTNPLPSLLGVSMPLTSVGTTRTGPSPNPDGGRDTFSTSTAPDGHEIPVVPPKEAESGVDYYMNIQAIQNLMGIMCAAPPSSVTS